MYMLLINNLLCFSYLNFLNTIQSDNSCYYVFKLKITIKLRQSCKKFEINAKYTYSKHILHIFNISFNEQIYQTLV